MYYMVQIGWHGQVVLPDGGMWDASWDPSVPHGTDGQVGLLTPGDAM